MFNELSFALIDSFKKTQNEITNNKKRNPKNKKFRSKSWWDSTIQRLHADVVNCYINYRNSNFSDNFRQMFKAAKRNFRARKRYNLMVKRNKNFKIIDGLFRLNKNEFWKSVKRLSRDSRKVNTEVKKLQDVYTRLFNEKNNMPKSVHLEKKLQVESYLEKYKNSIFDFQFDQTEINEVIDCLANGKSSGFGGVSNEMLKYSGSNYVTKILKTLFEKMVNYQTMPYHFNVAILKPIIKDKKNPNDDISNLRPVAISDAYANIFETLILKKLERQHTDNHKQFGFKKKASCSHAIFLLNHAIKISKHFNKRLYVCAVDASKAFDKVNRDILWSKLIKLELCPSIILSIVSYYNVSQMLVMNGDECSSLFDTKVGVRQGGAISPKLFAIYLEELITLVEDCHVGLKFGSQKIYVVAYADDVLLISTTKLGLQKQLNILQEYGAKNEIKYNPQKTVYMVFNQKIQRNAAEAREDIWQSNLTLDGSKIEKVSSMRYLGAEISEDDKVNNHIDKRKRLVQQAVNKLK